MTTNKLLIIFLCILNTSLIFGQIWPGDVNNNGIANNVDFLWFGSVYKEEGPQRSMSQQGIQWEEKNISNSWSDDFPNGVNYAFADCDGDGEVRFDDHSAFEMNYNETHGTVTPDVFVQGVEGIDPPLFFASSGPPTIEGNPLVLSINLGTMETPVNDLHGIAFTIRYDPALFSSDFGGGSFSLDNNSWIDEDGDVFDIEYRDTEEGVVEVGITRKNTGPIDGFGEIGNFFIVIEDHVVGLAEPDLTTSIWFENVQLLDENLNSTVVFADSVDVVILNDEIINSVENEALADIEIFPNPTKNSLWINAKNYEINQLKLFSTTGKLVTDFTQQINKNSFTELNLKNISTGIYFLKFTTPLGIKIEKIAIEE